MKKRSVLLLLPGLMFLVLGACGGAPTSTPTSVPTETAVTQNQPTEPATDEPATAVPATSTPEVVPTELTPTRDALFPTPVVTATPTLTPTVALPDYTVSIIEPGPAATLLAGHTMTFRGSVQPPTTEPLTVTLRVGSFTAVSTQVTPDDNGSWQVTTTVANVVSGPGTLTVALDELVQAAQPVQIAFDSATEEPYISLAKPVEGETAVAGHAFFMQGSSHHLLDNSFTIGIQVDNCTNFIAAQKISLAEGDWYGFVILPQNVTPGPACAVAYTGEYGAADWRQALVPIQLRAADDPQAVLLHLANSGALEFAVGEETTLFGVAVNVPERAVDIRLVPDSAVGSTQPVASGKAFADQFGFWSIDLVVPDDAPSGPVLLVVSAGEGDTYQEIRLPTTIAP